MNTKATSTSEAIAKIVSPGTRIQRRVCMNGRPRNSVLRAYQYPFSTEAQV